MITCGRCGKPAGIGGYGNNFRIFERFTQDNQKMAIKTDLCDVCQHQLIAWLNEGGYREHKEVALPIRNTTAEIVNLRNKLNTLIDKLESDEVKKE